MRAGTASAVFYTCNNLGNLHKQQGQLDQALARYQESIDLGRDLSRRSSDLQYTYGLAIGLENSALLLYKAGQRDEAGRRLEEANKLLRRIVAAEPHVPRYRQQLGRNLYNRGNQQCGEKRHAEAIPTLMEARDVLARLVESQPNVWWYQEDLGHLLHQLGRAYRALAAKDNKQLPKAAEAFQAACQVYKGLAAREPNSAARVYELAGCLFDTAGLQGKRNQNDDMLRLYREARDLGRRLVKAGPNVLDYRHLLGKTLNNLGREFGRLKQPDESIAALREAIEHNRFVFARLPRSDFHRRVLCTSYVLLAEAHRDAGRRDELLEALRQQRTLQDNHPRELFVIACALAQAKADDEAMRTLEQAVRQGWSDVGRLENEAALTGLRQRADFRKLLQDRKEKRSATPISSP